MPRKPPSPKPPTASDADALRASLVAFLSADKTPARPIAWSEDNGKFRFTVPLDIDGVTEEMITLRGRANTALSDQDITFVLRWTDAAGRGGPFERLDWRPKHRHVNRGIGLEEYRFAVMDGTHHHPLAENAALAIGLLQAMDENLPVAIPVMPEPQDWVAFLTLAEQRWRIQGLVNIPLPPWQGGLLPLTGGEGRGASRRGRRI